MFLELNEFLGILILILTGCLGAVIYLLIEANRINKNNDIYIQLMERRLNNRL